MSVERAVWIRCDGDGCDSQVPSDLTTRTVVAARRWARHVGWRQMTVRCSGDLCPDCWDRLKSLQEGN